MPGTTPLPSKTRFSSSTNPHLSARLNHPPLPHLRFQPRHHHLRTLDRYCYNPHTPTALALDPSQRVSLSHTPPTLLPNATGVAKSNSRLPSRTLAHASPFPQTTAAHTQVENPVRALPPPRIDGHESPLPPSPGGSSALERARTSANGRARGSGSSPSSSRTLASDCRKAQGARAGGRKARKGRGANGRAPRACDLQTSGARRGRRGRSYCRRARAAEQTARGSARRRGGP